MNSINLKARARQDGILKLEIPAAPNQAFDVLVVMQPVETEPVDELGWPIGFFEQTYGSLANDPIEPGVLIS